ncbi:ABC transporter permease [Terrimonas pollutisoli]|uniref:ABC transporter permease n=1 Tax=Terrimonas pollutisoli TaxID=3034147 RepID=UPI0023ED41C9|nr:ABC transporter permease [Terrimonas sp. H1YJ31]
MIKNYLKIAWRNITKNKFSSFINMGGLSIGMAVTLLIGLWIYDEVSFDKYHKNYHQIAQVLQNVTNNGEVQTVPTLPYPLASKLSTNYSNDFKALAMSGGGGDHILSLGDKKLTKKGSFFEQQMPEILTLKMIRGEWNGLKEPSSILLSQSTAKSFFGNADPMNQVMKIDNKLDVKVTGVYEDIPYNATLTDISFMAPWDLYFNNTEWIKTASDPWRPNAFQIFVQLADNADIQNVSTKIKDEKLKNVNEQLAKKKPQLFLHPMSKWHLYSDFKNGVNAGGKIKYVWMFGIIGLFVLLLACINFMNLSTARSEKRAKEVGIRKAVGSLRRQLVGQFFSESILITILSFLFSIVLVQLLLSFFNEVADKKMFIPWSNPLFWATGFVFSLIAGVIAGSYPAFYLSSFHPVKIVKGTFKVGRWASAPRKILVVLQFTVSVAMIIGTIVVFRQIQFSKDRSIGYDSNGLITIPMVTEDIHKHFNAVEKELVESGAVLSMAETGNPTTEIWGTSSGFEWKGKDPNLSVDFPRIDVSYDYGKTIDWKFKEGRDFSKDFASDSSALILNETAVNFMGLQSPIGETIKWFGEPYTVIGVVKDMIMQSPYEQVKPSVYRLYTEAQNFVIIKINPAISARAALEKSEKIFKKFNPAQPFEYKFVDEEYAKKFGNEERIGKLAGFFAILAIFISCLGLFGMASFMAEQRTKEIGVRKVLGASVFNVWKLLSKEFVLLVLVALFIGIPLAWYFMHNWLENYQYRTEISWWILAVAACGSLAITILTVSFQAIKAAIKNPVRSLRTE